MTRLGEEVAVELRWHIDRGLDDALELLDAGKNGVASSVAGSLLTDKSDAVSILVLSSWEDDTDTGGILDLVDAGALGTDDEAVEGLLGWELESEAVESLECRMQRNKIRHDGKFY